LFTNRNKENFQNAISQCDWNFGVLNQSDPNLAYTNFYHTLLNLYEQNFPLTKLSKRGSRDKKWITKGLKISSSHKNHLYRLWLKSKNVADEKNYKQYKALFIKLTKLAQTSYYREIFDVKVNSAKKIWSQINELCSYKKNKCAKSVITKLKIDNNEIIMPDKIAEELNVYLTTIGSSLMNKLPPCTTFFTKYLNTSINNSCYCADISVSEILKEIDRLRKRKTAGPDFLNSTLISNIAHDIVLPLQYIYNLSLTTGKFPNDLKIAKVIPIFKQGDTSSPSNYRPISLLPIFSKIFEKILSHRLLNFWNKNNFLYKYQFGFRANHSTTLALIELLDNIYNWLDDENYVVGVYFDLQKAFDTVNHEILLYKLYNAALRGTFYTLIKDYLSNRRQFTVNGSYKSCLMNVNCGVPQGSVLGPLLFLIYVNDIVNALDGVTPRLFADDTNLFLHNKNLNIL
jgi:hypothetical protein